MHHQSEQLLVGIVAMLDLVVHRAVVLIDDATLTAGVGIALAAVAGVSQLFSP
jgi:hypothetical protein